MTTNGRPITAHEATIRTATVEIRTLTISGKQITLAVFRQLPQGDLIVRDYDTDIYRLQGPIWGIVNYFWGKCDYPESHLHVVWQLGDELRRSCVWLDPEEMMLARFEPGGMTLSERTYWSSLEGRAVIVQYRALVAEVETSIQLFIAV